jgi:tetratricopeptide (TPR) repeat protein
VRRARVLRSAYAIGIAVVVSGSAFAQPSKAPSAAAPAAQRPQSPAVFQALYSGDAERALQLARAYLKTHPRDAGMMVLAARAHLARKQLGTAYDLLERALAIDPGNADALYFLGITSGELAAGTFERLYAMAPNSARVHQLMARSLKLQGNPVEAVAEYELALKADPDLVDALLEFARLRREESDCVDAQRLYERAEKVRSTYDGAYGLGQCLALRGDHARAVTAFRQALTHDPRSAGAHFDLGSSLLRVDDAAGAVAALERAAQLAPNVRETYYVLGRAYQRLNQPERAQQAFDRAAALARADRSGEPKPPR